VLQITQVWLVSYLGMRQAEFSSILVFMPILVFFCIIRSVFEAQSHNY